MYRVLQCHSIVPCRDRWPSWLFFRPPWTGYCYMLLWRGTHSSSFLNSHHTRSPAQTGSCSLQLQRNSLYQTLEFVKVMIYFNFKVDTKKNSKMMSTHLYIFRNRPPNSRCLLLPYTSRIWFWCYRSGRSLRHTDSGAGRRRWGTGQCGVEWMTPVKHSPRFLGHNTCL